MKVIVLFITNKYDEQMEQDCFDYIFVDHTYGMKLATEHLIQKGCKKIAVVSGSLTEQTTKERLGGYFDTLKKYGIEIDSSYILNGQYNNECAYEEFKQFIETYVSRPSIQ